MIRVQTETSSRILRKYDVGKDGSFLGCTSATRSVKVGRPRGGRYSMSATGATAIAAARWSGLIRKYKTVLVPRLPSSSPSVHNPTLYESTLVENVSLPSVSESGFTRLIYCVRRSVQYTYI